MGARGYLARSDLARSWPARSIQRIQASAKAVEIEALPTACSAASLLRALVRRLTGATAAWALLITLFLQPEVGVLSHPLGVQVRADRAVESTHPAPELRYAACSILAIRCCSARFQRTCLCGGGIAHICRDASCLAVNGSTYGASADVSPDPRPGASFGSPRAYRPEDCGPSAG